MIIAPIQERNRESVYPADRIGSGSLCVDLVREKSAPSRMLRSFRIRPYRETDRLAVQTICCDNAFLGQPIDAIFCDRSLFSAMFVDPYLDHASEWAFVAENESGIIGYLTGAISTRFLNVQILCCCSVTAKMVANTLAGKYRQHNRSRQFIRWLLTHAVFERARRPACAAHLHFNVVRGYRGSSVGYSLWRAFENKLNATGQRRYFGEIVSDRPKVIEKVYGRFGFSVYDCRPTSIFEPEHHDVWSICMIKTDL